MTKTSFTVVRSSKGRITAYWEISFSDFSTLCTVPIFSPWGKSPPPRRW